MYSTLLFYPAFEALLVLRFVQGIGSVLSRRQQFRLPQILYRLRERGAGLGYFTMSTNLAVVLGPLIALSIIQTFSFDVLFFVLSILMVIGV